MKKWISLLLVFALMVSTVICAFPLGVSAETTSAQQWLEYDAQELTLTDGAGGHWWTDTGSSSDWGVAISLGSAAYSGKKGYALIREFTMPEDGIFMFDTEWTGDPEGFSTSTAANAQYTAYFAVTDAEGKVIFPTDGQVAEIKYGEPLTVDVNSPFKVEAKAGDKFNFVFYNNHGVKEVMRSRARIFVNKTSETYNSSGALNGSDFTVQGNDGWRYLYAKSVNVTNIDPDGFADLGDDVYTAKYTAVEATYDPDKPNGAWVNANGQIVAQYGSYAYLNSTTESVICRYYAPEDGDFRIPYAALHMSGGEADFFIADKTGKIVWPVDGGPRHLSASSIDDKAAVFPFYYPNMKQGDYLDLVYTNRKTAFSGIGLDTSATFNGKRAANSAGGMFDKSTYGAVNSKTFVAYDLTVTKEANTAWKEFAVSDKALDKAPVTFEAQVKIPTTVADDKVSIIYSDMNTGDTAGYALMMAENGEPKLVLDGGAVNYTAKGIDLRTGEWLHIAFVRDTEKGEINFYINGQIASMCYATATGTTTGRAAVIGNDTTFSKETAFEGAMRHLALFSDARTADEIAKDAVKINASEEGLVAYYKLLTAVNNVYDDSSASKNHATVTTANSDWVAGTPEAAADDEHTLLHIGDTQMLTHYYQGNLPKLTQWIADNTDKYNIDYVVHTGDIVNVEDTQSQWVDAKAAFDILDNAGVKYALAAGNHEYPAAGGKHRDSTVFNETFPFANYFGEGSTYVGGYYEEGKMDNVYHFATIGSKTYMILSLENFPRQPVVDWAKQVVAANPEYPVIVATHTYLNTNGSINTTNNTHTGFEGAVAEERGITPTSLYDQFISQYANIQLVLCGHMACDDIITRVDIGVNGNKITTIMNDPSYAGDGGAGLVGLYRFKADGTIKVEYYSPFKNAYYRDSNQFTFDPVSAPMSVNVSNLTAMDNSKYADNVTWSKPNTYSPWVQYGGLQVYGADAVVRKWTADAAFTNKTLKITHLNCASEGDVEFAVLDTNGTIIYPAQGGYASVPATNKAIDIPIARMDAGESLYFVFRRANSTVTDNRFVQFIAYIPQVAKMSTGDQMPIQVANGWEFYMTKAANLDPVAPTYNITLNSSAKGGTVTSSAGDSVATGNTSLIKITADMGYHISSVTINGEFIGTFRGRQQQYAFNNVSADSEVRVIFAPDLKNDIIADSVIDVADVVAAYNYSNATNTVDLCANSGDIDNDTNITATDIDLFKKKALGITEEPELDYTSVINDGVLKISDCGIEEDSPFDYSVQIQAALKTAAANPGTVLEFESGTYNVSYGSDDTQHLFDLSEMTGSDLHINGNGATLMLTDNFAGCFNLESLQNVTIENLNFDLVENPFVQGTVTAYDTETMVMSITLDSDSDLLDDERMFDRVSTRYGMVRDKDNPYLMKEECVNYFKFDAWEKTGDRQYDVELSAATKLFTNDYIEVGDKIILNNRGDYTTFIFNAVNTGNVTLKNINIYNSAGGGLVARQNTGDILLENFNMKIKEGSSNWICGNADAVHVQGSKGKVEIKNCDFANISDDAVNLYQWYGDVKEVLSETEMIIKHSGTNYAVGDTVKIVEGATATVMAHLEIAEIEVLDVISEQLKLTFTENIGIDVGEYTGKYHIYSDTYSFPESSVTDSSFTNIRGRALYLHSIGTTVEGNTFTNISNHAIEAWYQGDEGFNVEDLVINNNTFTNVSYLYEEANGASSGTIVVHINAGTAQSTNIIHDGIQITNNTINDYHGVAVNIGNAKDVTVSGNKFNITGDMTRYDNEYAIFANYSDGITIENNEFNDAREDITAAICYDSQTVTNITVGTNTYACAADKQVVTQ